MKEALERLGYRCHHMLEVFSNLEQASLFTEAASDSDFDWERIYGPYRATVDFPGCLFWRELAAFYPEAKVVLNVRPADEYYESFHATIQGPMVGPLHGPTVEARWDEMIRRVVVPRAFPDGNPADRDTVMANFERHNAEVRNEVSADRLLVFSVSQGWDPLTGFLGLDAPQESFPHVNTRDEWGKKPASR